MQSEIKTFCDMELSKNNTSLESKNESLESKNESLESKIESLESKNELLECKNELLESKNALLESKNKVLVLATMIDLVNIVSPCWKVPSENLDEVVPGIFIGDEIAAKDIGMLKHLKVTHILNSAYSEMHSFLFVNTSQNYYRERKFECNFLGLSAVDCPTYKLSKFFQQASDFIDLAVNCPDGKILVHCRQGVSRSATFVIIYLMISKKMTGREAVTLVRTKRNIFPNKGFLKEICDFENQLIKSKHYDDKFQMNSYDNNVTGDCNVKAMVPFT